MLVIPVLPLQPPRTVPFMHKLRVRLVNIRSKRVGLSRQHRLPITLIPVTILLLSEDIRKATFWPTRVLVFFRNVPSTTRLNLGLCHYPVPPMHPALIPGFPLVPRVPLRSRIVTHIFGVLLRGRAGGLDKAAVGAGLLFQNLLDFLQEALDVLGKRGAWGHVVRIW